MKNLRSIFFSIIISSTGVFAYSAELPIEEIIVNEAKSLSLIRHELLNAEDKMHEIFNTLIGETDFKILCDEVVRVGSHFSKRECEPKFIIEARQKDYQKGIAATGNPLLAMEYVRVDRVLNRHFRSKRQEMENVIIDLAMENPDLFNAIMNIQYLKEELEDVKQERFGD